MTAFIIDTYNKFDIFDREHSRYVFEINGNMYAIKEVYMKWGRPKLPLRIGAEKDQEQYKIYDTYEDAMEFVHTMRGLNAAPHTKYEMHS